jgi:adenosine kinase
MKKILVTGTIAYDVLLRYGRSFADAFKGADLEKLSVSFFSEGFARHHGGTGANIAWHLRLLGQMPLLVGAVGHDGGEYLQMMESRGIPVGGIHTSPKHVTATAIIGTDDGDRQIAFFHPGADAADTWRAPEEGVEDIALAIVGARNPLVMMDAVRWCKQAGIPLFFDPGQLVLGLSKEDLLQAIDGATGVFANTYEWELIAEKTGLTVETLLQKTGFLVVTEGGDGLTIHTAGKTTHVPACPVENVVNPTGAGDALRAGFLAGLASGWELVNCGRLGAVMGALAVAQEGTLLDTLDVEEAFGRAREIYGEDLPSLGEG